MTQIGPKANGGIESLLNILLGLRDVEVLIVTQHVLRDDRVQRAEHINTLIIPSGNLGNKVRRYWDILRTNRLVYRIVGDFRPDAVHINDVQFLLRGIGALLLWGKAPVVNIRGTNPPGRPYGKHWKVLRHCDKVVVLSKDMRRDMIERMPLAPSLLREKIRVIPSIVDFERFYPVVGNERLSLRGRLDLPPQRKIVLMAARVCPRKQQLGFISELARQIDIVPEGPLFIFAGDFSLDDDYCQQCYVAARPLLELDAIRFVGFKPNINDYMAAADLAVISSRAEGMARGMIEPLACGTPVVSFDVASAHEVLTEHHAGRVLPQGHFDRLIGEIMDLLGKPELRRTMAQNGQRMTRSTFHIDDIVKQYKHAYFG